MPDQAIIVPSAGHQAARATDALTANSDIAAQVVEATVATDGRALAQALGVRPATASRSAT